MLPFPAVVMPTVARDHVIRATLINSVSAEWLKRVEWNSGRILLGLFWLFLFRSRNNRINGISIYFEKNVPSENRIPMAEVTWELLCLHTRGRPRRISWNEIGLFRGNRIPFILFILLLGGEWMEWYSVLSENRSQKNTNTVYSEYSYSGIVPKEHALSFIPALPRQRNADNNAHRVKLIELIPKKLCDWSFSWISFSKFHRR